MLLRICRKEPPTRARQKLEKHALIDFALLLVFFGRKIVIAPSRRKVFHFSCQKNYFKKFVISFIRVNALLLVFITILGVDSLDFMPKKSYKTRVGKDKFTH